MASENEGMQVVEYQAESYNIEKGEDLQGLDNASLSGIGNVILEILIVVVIVAVLVGLGYFIYTKVTNQEEPKEEGELEEQTQPLNEEGEVVATTTENAENVEEANKEEEAAANAAAADTVKTEENA